MLRRQSFAGRKLPVTRAACKIPGFRARHTACSSFEHVDERNGEGRERTAMWADSPFIHGLASGRCGRRSVRFQDGGSEMSTKMTRVPEALETDVPDVVEALDIARMLFDKGDAIEAARFVRRASDAANKASRLIELARAADAIESSVPAPAVSETRLSRPAVAPTAAPVTSRPPPLPPRKPTSSPPPVPTAKSAPPVPKVASNPPPSMVTPKPASKPSMPAAKVPSSAPRLASATKKSAEDRMRVCVRMSVRDGSLLVVRPLADGETPPAGTREAWLVMADADEGRRSAAR
jgi:hypothetical protein